eukprot:CAMPEP_0170477670 /NCGR_PEP_ID=MMETSP0123-20130129/18872_1 /TAXON_ID=182087 /ORGANISM="Favella ehrenbergii, Strain Fehren 1" /LENGTH=78 /DNA_ID=CAMNT_0010749515 /DNA_START=710 /DNA_END=946 /DNA_ORIENTATION=+
MYQTKLKQLMEELRFAKEKQNDLGDKLQQEQAQSERQMERISNLETTLAPYAQIDLQAEIRELEMRTMQEQEQNGELL